MRSPHMENSLRTFLGNERAAWRSLAGCQSTPRDPYDNQFIGSLLEPLKPQAPRLSWELVVDAWKRASMRTNCTSSLILVSLYKGRVAAAMCSHPQFRRQHLGVLGHYRVL